VTGVSSGFGGPGPTGIPVTAARCKS
jgi:hypothetical protein